MTHLKGVVPATGHIRGAYANWLTYRAIRLLILAYRLDKNVDRNDAVQAVFASLVADTKEAM